MNMNKFRFEGEQIVLTFFDGTYQVYKINKSPIYGIGTTFFDYNGERYFLQ